MHHSQMRLGATLRPIPPNVPTFRAHAIAEVKAPPKLVRDHINYRPILGDNDRIGDCSCVGVANVILAQAALGGFQVDIPAPRVVDLYAKACGYVPGQPQTDQGGVLVDVLGWQLAHGFDTGEQTRFAGLWGNIDPEDVNLVRVAMTRLGTAYAGINLAEADKADGVWDTKTPASAGDPTPGTWGGHLVDYWSYDGTEDTDLVQIATWGTLRTATWRWVQSRMVEVHGLYHRQLAGPNRMLPTGVDPDRLAADGAAFNGAVV